MQERQPGEPDAAWSTYLRYRAQPPGARGLRRLVGPGLALRTLARWSKTYRWPERATDYDRAGAPRPAPVLRLAGLEDTPQSPAPTATAIDPDADPADELDRVLLAEAQRLQRSGGLSSTDIAKLTEARARIDRSRTARQPPPAVAEYDLEKLTAAELGILETLLDKAAIT